MNARRRELRHRQRELQLRCAVQRAAVANEVRAIEERFAPVDRIAGLARSTLFQAAIVMSVTTLLTAGRVRGLGWLARAMLFGAAVRRLLVAVRRL